MNYLIIIFLLVLVYFIFYKTETFENASAEKTILIDAIYNFMKSDSKYGDYINILKSYKNMSYKLAESDTFAELRLLTKKGILKKDNIYEFATDMK